MKEMWKSVIDYEGLYEISNKGRLRSVDRITPDGRRVKGKLKKPSKDKNGYLVSQLYKDGSSKNVKLHRLVLQAFVGPDKLQVNHLDGNKKNNEINNLEYCTSKENHFHASKKGLRSQVGETHTSAKLKEEQVFEIKRLLKNSNLTQQQIADAFKVNRRTINQINTGRRWSHLVVV